MITSEKKNFDLTTTRGFIFLNFVTQYGEYNILEGVQMGQSISLKVPKFPILRLISSRGFELYQLGASYAEYNYEMVRRFRLQNR